MARNFLLANTGAPVGGITVTELTGSGAQATFAPAVKQFETWRRLDEWFVGLGANRKAIADAKETFDSSGGAQLIVE
jgi:hypothetical protein